MGSVGNQINPWAPYDNYRDCTQEICSIYCPQFCYLIFPPPPPSDDAAASAAPFSPLIIAIIGVLTSALVLVSYYAVVTRYCRKRRTQSGEESGENPDDDDDDPTRHHENGLDENLIRTIAVCRYRKGDGLVEGTDCAVCLSEFREDESLRLLPKCSHAFHLPCIDTWLKSHPNCPLCRANVLVPVESSRAPPSSTEAYYNVSSYEFRRPDDLVLVVDDREDAVMRFAGSNDGFEDLGDLRSDRKRSVSLGAFSSHRQLLVSDILRIEESDEDLCNVGFGSSSKGIISGLIRSPPAMKRSVSAGRFVFNARDRGNTSTFHFQH